MPGSFVCEIDRFNSPVLVLVQAGLFFYINNLQCFDELFAAQNFIVRRFGFLIDKNKISCKMVLAPLRRCKWLKILTPR